MAWYNPFSWGDESDSTKQKRDDLNEQGDIAGTFAGRGELGYHMLGEEAKQARDYLRDLASGKNSLSSEQLRQGLGQQLAQQRSFAASASPQNAPMAARNAMMNMNRASSGLSGQAAMAGIAERQAAQQALMDAILRQRQQDAQVALGSRQTAVGAYGGVTPEGTFIDKYGGAILGGLAAGAKFSDRRLKHEIDDGDADASKALKGLRAYTYKYKDKKLGKDRELGVMAQDLEKAGLKHTVFETPRGKAVNGAALSTANTALIAALSKRVEKIEGKR